MDDAGRVEVLDAAEQLVEQVGHALVVELHLDHLTQVRVHQLHHQVPARARQNTQCHTIACPPRLTDRATSMRRGRGRGRRRAQAIGERTTPTVYSYWTTRTAHSTRDKWARDATQHRTNAID